MVTDGLCVYERVACPGNLVLSSFRDGPEPT